MNRQSSTDFLNKLVTNLKESGITVSKFTKKHGNAFYIRKNKVCFLINSFNIHTCIVVIIGFENDTMSPFPEVNEFIIRKSRERFSKYISPELDDGCLGWNQFKIMIMPKSKKYCGINTRTGHHYLSNKKMAKITKEVFDCFCEFDKEIQEIIILEKNQKNGA